MKRFELLASLVFVLIIFAFGHKSETIQSKQKQVEYPEGYPQELTLPDGFTSKDIKIGSGTTTGGGQEKRTYKSYGLNKMRNQCPANLLEHYQKIVEKNEWKGKWQIYSSGGSGTFTKGNMEMEVKINDMVFSFKVKVFN